MSDIEQARQNLPLPELMEKMGFGEFAKSSVRSPFREEKSPSWGIYESGGRWRFKDHGTGEGGDEVDFIEKVEGLDRKAAMDRFCEIAGTQKRPQRQEQNPPSGKYSFKGSMLLWEKLRDAADNDFLSKLAIARGIEFTTMEWARDIGILGNKDGMPAFKNGEGVHHKAESGWRFFPHGIECEALTFGDRESRDVYVFESQWDALAIADAIGIEGAAKKFFVVTRGASNGKLAGKFSDGKNVYAFPQNDPPKAKGKIPSEDWWENVESACEDGAVLRVRVPKKYKDANDWVRDGVKQAAVISAIQSAYDPILSTVEVQTFGQLWAYDSTNDKTILLGNRWVCEGGQLLLVGQSGIGKSSLSVQAAMFWALGKPFFGIQPREGKGLRALFIQAENDIGDMGEMAQGVMSYVVANSGMSAKQAGAILTEKIHFARVTSHVGDDFPKVVSRLLDRYGEKDLVFVDPLLSYVGGDISRQDVMSHFLRQLCNPLAFERRFAWVFSHHTGKPQSDSKSRSHWNANDYAYAGMGSSELTNWARAIAVLQTTKTDGQYRLLLAKRGRRAGMVDGMDQPTIEVGLKHADSGLHWEPCPLDTPDTTSTQPSKGGAPKAISEAVGIEIMAFVATWPHMNGSYVAGLYQAIKDRFGLKCTRTTISNFIESKKNKAKN
jgi:hypothetical protein